ncbi:MAG: 1,2-phenylacetyl-CoA epoxidase subunit PaaE [Gammaproteobacteria bacterium]
MAANFYPLNVKEIIQETDDAKRLVLSVADQYADKFTFKHGQYLTFLKEIDGEEVRRSYSICSSVNDSNLEVAVKKIEGGAFSTYINEQLAAGDELQVAPPAGDFTVPLDPENEKHYLCIAAGSGITPIVSIVKTILETEPKSQVSLLFGNKRVNSIMFKEQLESLKNTYMQRFQLIHVLSQEDREFDILNGRIDNKKGAELCRHLLDLDNTDEFFLCGPEAMVSEVSRGLRASGIDEEHIRYELFGASADDAKVAVQKHHDRAKKHQGKLFNVTVINDGRSVRFELGADGENILDAALDAGVDLPFACKGGVCATCKAKLTSGEVEMDINHALEPKEIAAGTILSCQAHPTTDDVVIDFDQSV